MNLIDLVLNAGGFIYLFTTKNILLLIVLEKHVRVVVLDWLSQTILIIKD